MPIYAAQGAVEADVKRDLDYSRFSLNKSLSALAHGYAKLWNSVSRVDLRVFSMWLWERLLAGFYTCPLPLISLFLLVNYQSVLLKGSRESEKMSQQWAPLQPRLRLPSERKLLQRERINSSMSGPWQRYARLCLASSSSNWCVCLVTIDCYCSPRNPRPARCGPARLKLALISEVDIMLWIQGII